MSAVERSLSWRARAALEATREAVQASGPARTVTAARAGGRRRHTSEAPSAELLDSLRHHLLAGETHYPDRPGMVELRRLVGAALPGIGYPRRDPDGVLITMSEGESLFVTLLGLGAEKGTRFTGSAPGRHQALFDWMGLGRAESDAAASLHYRDTTNSREAGPQADSRFDRSVPCVHTVGGSLFASGGWAFRGDVPASLIVVGSLDGLDGMHPFRLGFVAAEPEILAGITRWKQASSICSPAPSQRAALWALGVRP
ncbi:MAG: hypothetical protein OXU74_17800 [Gemmatimonadota bacterium]|nr:hypothetical protein [Gemmatimonadota bacterium]